jgi:hypothetical protein
MQKISRALDSIWVMGSRDEEFLSGLSYKTSEDPEYKKMLNSKKQLDPWAQDNGSWENGRAVVAWDHSQDNVSDHSRGLNPPSYVGHVSWKPDGEIHYINTKKRHQHKGVAGELWNHAKKIEPNLHHSETLSDEGRAWSQNPNFMKDGQ